MTAPHPRHTVSAPPQPDRAHHTPAHVTWAAP
jgi:hypothetical protein